MWKRLSHNGPVSERNSLPVKDNGNHKDVALKHNHQDILINLFKYFLVLFLIGIAMIMNYHNNGEFISLSEDLNEILVYGGGALTVLLTVTLYKTLKMIPSIDQHMLLSSSVVGGVALCLLYWYVLVIMDVPVFKTIFKTILYLIIFFIPFIIVLVIIEGSIEKIYTELMNKDSFLRYEPDDETIIKLTLCALLVSPLIYLPLLFSALIPLWNYLFK